MEVTLSLVVPPSDIRQTKPTGRLILNQISRCLSEDLNAKRARVFCTFLSGVEYPTVNRPIKGEAERMQQALLVMSSLQGRQRQCLAVTNGWP
jgi:hypothetical protein